jgi:hypothetical protein
MSPSFPLLELRIKVELAVIATPFYKTKFDKLKLDGLKW